MLKYPDVRMRLGSAMLAVALLAACGAKIKTPEVSITGSYESALRYFHAGEIMRARNAALKTDPRRPDYAKAQQLLKKKIEPARLRLLRHYRRAAQKAEKRGVLYRARAMYLKAAELSIGGTRMQRKARRIDLILRQRRLNDLSRQRRREDAQLLAALRRYHPPAGLDPKDKVYMRERDRMQRRLLARARNAWRAAKRELHEGHPEAAYVEAESFMRLRPGSRRAPLLMREVKAALPKGLRLPARKRAKSAATVVPKSVSAAEIRQLMQREQWLKAHEFAVIYQREDGEGADALLQSINKKLKKLAENEFRAGQVAFKNEQLDKAVEHWKMAVELQPENRDYADSLRRASELQERFRILRQAAGK